MTKKYCINNQRNGYDNVSAETERRDFRFFPKIFPVIDLDGGNFFLNEINKVTQLFWNLFDVRPARGFYELINLCDGLNPYCLVVSLGR